MKLLFLEGVLCLSFELILFCELMLFLVLLASLLVGLGGGLDE